jgi:DNA-binding NtrC family response regulator
MSQEFDFLTPTDKPALIGLSTVELQESARAALDQLGYKVHTAVNHGEFLHKIGQVAYQVVILEELFAATTPEENESLEALRRMPMISRRHATILLFGYNMATFNPMQAFQQCVHAVINPSEMFLLIQLIQKAVADNDMFLHTFRESQQRVA